jgi:hypothetical protein
MNKRIVDKLNLKKKSFVVIVLFSSILFIDWGNVGHRIINGNSMLSFPEEIDFLISWANGLAEHASDAYKRKSSEPNEETKHYIDIDNFPEFVTTLMIPQEFDSIIAKYGYNFVMDQGILPWAIIETADSLTAAFRNKQWDRAMLLAADLGHYIGDAFTPLHITRNYNGQYSNQGGVHSRYESKLIERFDHEIYYAGDSVIYITNISDYAFNMIYENYIYVDSALIADRIATAFAVNTESDDYYTKFWQLLKSFTIHLFEGASNKLASLIYTCWIDAGSPNPTTNVALNKPMQDFVLYQNYPNPFNSQNNVTFELEKKTNV